ncbi:type VI secretion system lipoprotein TssJ [Lentibacter algarum]|uniref:type VI secretion system lipoprotein TssJ n=1 Tax=Lentibacter algarum TaxID=576131 RepID=UPI001C06D3C5|nr:type VI secretion system lipoprotein TssJ [Lentibacter algarum]MBU2980569.1 type VI secretion system lipoprotein TssJ [Lentibacter algarum]
MTYFTRRRFMITAALGAGGALLAGCMGEAPPAVLAISAQSGAGMNPGPGGGDRPVTLTVLQLTSAASFDGADYFALQNPASALGSDLVRSDQIVLAPGGSASKAITIQPGVSVIGVVGGFRSPTGKTVRAKISAPGASSGLIINVGSKGLSLSSA